jgi:hypothetical protein
MRTRSYLATLTTSISIKLLESMRSLTRPVPILTMPKVRSGIIRFGLLGRVRIFYDYMRQKYEPEIRTISQSKRDLDEFSRVCSGEMQGSATLEDIFRRKPELKELCRVNKKVMSEITILLNTPGPDRTRMNWDNASISAQMIGGDGWTDYSRVFGTYSTLSVFPLKLAAVNVLTTPYPYTMLGGWMFPIPRYSGQDGLFSYSTLYSREFTSALASALEKNIKTETEARRKCVDWLARPFSGILSRPTVDG